jgi:hypothetical protein
LKGKDLEISGVADKVEDGAVVLIGKGNAKVVCALDPNATDSMAQLRKIEKGRYVVIKGHCEASDSETVKLDAAQVVAVVEPKKKKIVKPQRQEKRLK